MYKETCSIFIVTYYIKWVKTSWTYCTTASASVSSCPERATNYATGSKLFVSKNWSVFDPSYSLFMQITKIVGVRSSYNRYSIEIEHIQYIALVHFTLKYHMFTQAFVYSPLSKIHFITKKITQVARIFLHYIYLIFSKNVWMVGEQTWKALISFSFPFFSSLFRSSCFHFQFQRYKSRYARRKIYISLKLCERHSSCFLIVSFLRWKL